MTRPKPSPRIDDPQATGVPDDENAGVAWVVRGLHGQRADDGARLAAALPDSDALDAWVTAPAR